MTYPAPLQEIQSTKDKEASIGRILLESGKLRPTDAERVLRVQKERGIRFGEAAKSLGLISEKDIQEVLAQQFDYPYLQTGQGNYPAELVAAYEPFSAQVETLRTIRSQLMLRWFATGRKALVIASVNAQEGASLLAANLAVVFSQLGEHTLLVDANLRNPHQHRVFNLGENSLGLSDILAGRAGLENITKTKYFVDLSVLPAGTTPPNPQELFNRPAFNELNNHCIKHFDIVLIDASSFSAGADAMALAARIGGILLVARKDFTLLSDIEAAVTQLRQNGTEVVGSVLLDF